MNVRTIIFLSGWRTKGSLRPRPFAQFAAELSARHAINPDEDERDAQDLPHVFERFYHGKNSGGDSVGIGLALAKAVFENENAGISVESRENEGTKFEIRFYKSVI